MASHLQSSTEAHLALACVKLSDTQEQLANTQAELNQTKIQLNDIQTQLDDTQAQLYNTQETTWNLEKKMETFQRQLKEKMNKGQVNVVVEEKVMQMKKTNSFLWEIQNFSEVLRQTKELGDFLQSDPFYTESCGYKMQLLLYPNGNGSGANTHMSVFLSLMAGEYDSLLSWPFITDVTFTLIDQQRFQRQNVDLSFTHKVTERPKENSCCNLGIPNFVSHEKLKTRGYLKDDTLFLRVVIGPDSSKLNWWSTEPLWTFEWAE